MMTILKVLGDLLEGSGWTAALVQADIVSTGAAAFLLKASHVTRTRNVHQVTACAVYGLLKNAYLAYTSEQIEIQMSSSLMTGVLVELRRAHIFTAGP